MSRRAQAGAHGAFALAGALLAAGAAQVARAEPPPAVPPDLPAAIVEQPKGRWELPLEPGRDRREGAVPERPPASSRSVAGAPLPDQAQGMAVSEPEGQTLRAVASVLLVVPRSALEVTGAPVRGALWVYDRYQLSARAREIFFNDAGTMGLYPVGSVESDFGLTAGARFIHRDLFGARERLSMRTSFGGLYNQQYTAQISTGDRLGPVRLDGEGEYEIEPRERFFGIGNGDEVAAVTAPVDPYVDPAAVDSRFRERVGRVYGKARVKVLGPLSTRLTSGVLWKRFERSSPGDIPPGTDITRHYQVDALPAFEQGTSYVYDEIELRYDSRRPVDVLEPPSLASTGWLFAGFGGVARSFGGARVRYLRYGGDVQRYLRAGESPRVIVLRLLAEEVRGEEDEIPFVDLPRLGGPVLLRGYPRDRFRDRAMALASAEYLFDLGSNLAGFLFVDGGRVLPRLADLTAEDARVGYGGGVQVFTDASLMGRLSVASSVDGGLFLSFSFDPVYQPQAPVERD